MNNTVFQAAGEIISRLAWSNNISSEEMRRRVEDYIQNELDDSSSHLSALRCRLFGEILPSMDEMIVAFKQELYDKLIRQFDGWVWTGDGYLNTNYCSPEQWNTAIANNEKQS